MVGFLRRLTAWFSAGPRSLRQPLFQLELLEDRSLPSVSNLPLPILSSDPGAPASLYLDFTGLPTENWGSYQNVTTPVFHLDGSGSLFTANEVGVITEVWQRVAEIYSPFNLNVTTVAPADLSHGKTQIVAIGGSYNDWFHTAAGGISYVGSFTNTAEPNISHVFVDGTAGIAADIAIAAAHEAGHAFGLSHQSVFNAAGQLTAEYSPGDSTEAPIMGLAYNAARAVWWVGTADVNGTEQIQNDEAVIGGAVNGFGYRPDYYGQSFATATPLTVLNGQPGAVGVIDAPTSIDYFSFTTSGGAVSLNVDPAAVGPMLHARLELYSGSTLIGIGGSAAALGASISTTLAAGNYYVLVRSNGNYGDVGQYSLSVNAPAGGGVLTGAAQATVFTVASDRSLWAENVATQNETLLSPAGTILAISPSKDAYGDDIVFALASDHSLWAYSHTGWVILSPAGTISALSASSNGVVFALASDDSLWVHSPTSGWSILSPASTINALAASPGDVVFALASDHSLWSHSSAGWTMLSPAGTILSIAAGADASGTPAATVVASNDSLWEYDNNAWQMLAPAGSIAAASPVVPSAAAFASSSGLVSSRTQNTASEANSIQVKQHKQQEEAGFSSVGGAVHSADRLNSDAALGFNLPDKPFIPMCMCPACVAARKAAMGT